MESDNCGTEEGAELLLPLSSFPRPQLSKTEEKRAGGRDSRVSGESRISCSTKEGHLASEEEEEEENFDGEMDYKGGGGDNEEAKSKLMSACGGSAETLEQGLEHYNSFTNAGYKGPEEEEGEKDERTSSVAYNPSSYQTPVVSVGGNNRDCDESPENSINSKDDDGIRCGNSNGRGGEETTTIIDQPLPPPPPHHSSDPPEKFQWNQRRQVFAALAANMGAMALGSVASWTATALPDLRKSGEMGEFSQNQESWIGSIMTLGAIVSCPVAGFGIEKVGRRMTMLLLTLPFLAGWLAIFFAQNLAMIYAGRFITGFCSGAFSIAVPVFIAEASDLNIRGALASGFDMMITVGILYIFIVGTYAPWRLQALGCAVIPIVCHALMFFVPESPVYLVERGKLEEAEKAVTWLRSSSPSADVVKGELFELKKSVAARQAAKISGSWRDLLTIPVIKPTSICLALMFFQQMSGIDAVMFYTVDIFHSAGSDMDENMATNIVGAVQVAATVTAALIVDNRGRRLLLLLSAIFMVLSLGSMGLYFYLKHTNGGVPPEGLAWIPLTSLMVYVISFSVGFGPIPWLMLGELIPPRAKGLAAGIVTIARWILGFVVTLVFQDVMILLGEHGGYWLLASCCLVGLVYTYFFVPETKGKSLDEIQMMFRPQTSVNDRT